MSNFEPVKITTAGYVLPYKDGQFIKAYVPFSDGTKTYEPGLYIDFEGERRDVGGGEIYSTQCVLQGETDVEEGAFSIAFYIISSKKITTESEVISLLQGTHVCTGGVYHRDGGFPECVALSAYISGTGKNQDDIAITAVDNYGYNGTTTFNGYYTTLHIMPSVTI